MRDIGTPKIGSHITNSHIKRPRITVNLRIGSRKRPFLDLAYAKSQIKRPPITRAACSMFLGKEYVFAPLKKKSADGLRTTGLE